MNDPLPGPPPDDDGLPGPPTPEDLASLPGAGSSGLGRIREQIRQTQEFLYRCEQDIAATGYRSARHRLWTGVLSSARAGTLAQNWREHLTIDTAGRDEIRRAVLGDSAAKSVNRTQSADADTLAVHEMAMMPIRPWEPHAAGGDWRAALEAWYADTLALDEYRVGSFGGGLDDSFSGARDAMEIIRNLWTASYRAGLAAGGEDNDWLAWLESSRTRPVADPTGLRQHLEQLPDYWTERS